MPDFTQGTEEAEKVSSKGGFARTEFLSIEDGKSVDIRFLTDHFQLITVDQHGNVPTRPAPEGYTGKWPQRMGAVCRLAVNDRGKRVFPEYEDCFLCMERARTGDDKTYKATPRSWSLAVLREVVMEGGRQVGMRDVMHEIEVEGQGKIVVPKIVVLNYAWGNFFSGLSTIQQLSSQRAPDTNGTWLDRDIRVMRKGEGLKTDYSFGPHEAIGKPGADGVCRAPQSLEDVHDLRDPAVIAKYLEHMPGVGATAHERLISIVSERAANDFFDRFFDTRHAQPKSGSANEADAQQQVSKPAQDEPSADALEAMAARVAGHSAPSAEPMPGMPSFSG